MDHGSFQAGISKTRVPIERGRRGEQRKGRKMLCMPVCHLILFMLAPFFPSLPLLLSLLVACAIHSFSTCIRLTYLSALPSLHHLDVVGLVPFSCHLSCLFFLRLRSFLLTFSFEFSFLQPSFSSFRLLSFNVLIHPLYQKKDIFFRSAWFTSLLYFSFIYFALLSYCS